MKKNIFTFIFFIISIVNLFANEAKTGVEPVSLLDRINTAIEKKKKNDILHENNKGIPICIKNICLGDKFGNLIKSRTSKWKISKQSDRLIFFESNSEFINAEHSENRIAITNCYNPGMIHGIYLIFASRSEKHLNKLLRKYDKYRHSFDFKPMNLSKMRIDNFRINFDDNETDYEWRWFKQNKDSFKPLTLFVLRVRRNISEKYTVITLLDDTIWQKDMECQKFIKKDKD